MCSWEVIFFRVQQTPDPSVELWPLDGVIPKLEFYIQDEAIINSYKTMPEKNSYRDFNWKLSTLQTGMYGRTFVFIWNNPTS